MNPPDAHRRRQERPQAPRPRITYNADLPITAERRAIVDAIRRNQVTVITGETGSGKTTQLPKMCIEAGRGHRGLIGCTQPRRVAAVTVAQRLAEELGEELGQSVAYKIRFDEKSGPRPLIKVMTDGILLVETQTDRLLKRYDTIIVDEAHERSLNIDFVLGILRSILPKRPDLKVIITSATLDTEKFSKAFHDAPIIEVSGRLYPVDLLWRPVEPELEERGSDGMIEAAVDAVAAIRKQSGDGDTLIFMPTEQDIWETCGILEGRYGKDSLILPLFARLPWHDQRRVFQTSGQPKIIVATNVAETSLTIPNIRYVIDTGLARIAQYNPRSRTAGLPVQPISQSSADQRKGRCGRVRHGVCIRLYNEEDYKTRPVYTQPEILRSSLAGVILQMLYLRLADISVFPFIDLPAKRHIADALDILLELGAVEKTEKDKDKSPTRPYRLTDRGRLMARLPIDPRIARMIIEGQKRGCLDEVAIIASGLTIADPRERPAEKKAQADQMHAPFKDPSSDFLTLLRIWMKCHDALEEGKSQNRLRKYCRDHFLSYKRLREWRDVHRQIRQVLDENRRDSRWPDRPADLRPDDLNTAIHKSILSGYLGNIAEKKEKNLYQGTKGREAMVFPGSSLWGRGGRWIVAAEMVETSRLFARVVANVEPEWIEEVGRDLCRSTYADPHWEKQREDVVASEKVTLFGLTIVPRRPVSYSRIDPAEASPLFIRQGLIPGEVKSRFAFLQHNLALAETLHDLENKSRRRDLLDEEAMFRFYAERLPGIANIADLRKWIRKRGSDKTLYMTEADMTLRPSDPDTMSDFPDQALVAGVSLPLTYRFEPGGLQDGITLTVPPGILASLREQALDWSVPGILRERVQGLLRNLPKEFRRKLPPLPQIMEQILSEMPRGEGSLSTAMGKFIRDRYDIAIPASAWAADNLPDHLRLRIAVTDGTDRILTASRSLDDLRQSILAGEESAALETVRSIWERSSLTAWDFGDLPESVPLSKNNRVVGYAFPALTTEGLAVHLRLFENPDEARQAHPLGVRQLYETILADDLRHLKKSLALTGKWRIWAEAMGGVKALEKRLYGKVVHDLMALPIRSQAAFLARREEIRKKILPRGSEVLRLAGPVVDACYATFQTLERLEKANRQSPMVRQFINRLRTELNRLVPDDFLILYEEARLPDIIRYLRALAIRADRGLLHLEKDRIKAADIDKYEAAYEDLLTGSPPSAEKKAALEELRWMLEELKVSVFAQELKTPAPVSGKRIDLKLQDIKML